MIVIYIIINLVNGKVYIGSTSNITHRFKKHINDLKNGIHHNEHLQRAWDKYGSDSFEFKTLMVCPDKERNHCEQMMIDLYDSQNHVCGYNIRDADFHSVSEETKEKLRKANSGENNYNYRHDIDTDILAKEYFNNGLSENDIAIKYNISKSMVHKRLVSTGRSLRDMAGENHPMYRHDLNPYVFKQDYDNGLSTVKIAKKYNTNPTTVRRYLNSIGVDTTNHGKYNNLWNVSIVYYNKNTMLKDGGGNNPRKSFYIMYNKKYRLPLGGFIDFVTVEIINDLIREMIE